MNDYTTTEMLTEFGKAELRIEIDWGAIGGKFAAANSEHQMEFLIGMASEFARWGNLSAALQLTLIAGRFEVEEHYGLAARVADYLGDLSNHLHDVAAKAPEPTVTPINSTNQEVFA